MRNKEITTIATGIYGMVSSNLVKLAEVNEGTLAKVKSMDAETAVSKIRELVAGVENIMTAAVFEGKGLPQYLTKVTYTEGNLDEVTVSVRTKLRSPYKYVKEQTIPVDENFITAVGKLFTDALFDMYYIDAARENVAELNGKLLSITMENEIPYTVAFDVAPDSSAMVLDISDNCIVFNADVKSAHNIDSLPLYAGGDEYHDFVHDRAVEEIVSALKTAQTPVQLIKSKLGIIRDVTGVSTKKRVDKLIRCSFHRKAENLDKVKSGVGYYEGKAEINGETADVFALVSKNEGGEYEVYLSPFNVKTLDNVDFDVLNAVKIA